MLVAPLNWGLGHATRCIPIINALIKANFEPILASDGDALLLLQKEFPSLKSFKLPSYNIRYTKKGSNLKWKLLQSIPSVISAVKKEKEVVKKLIEKERLAGIISDNRFGVFSKKVPSVYITHQLNVLSGNTTFLTSKIHQRIIKRFDECWVPDFKGDNNLSGKLGHLSETKLPITHIGILSRFKPSDLDIKYEVLVLLSGPEPQRTLLENLLLKELKNYKGSVLFVRGILTDNNEIGSSHNFKVENYLLAKDLEKAINQSGLVIARSGYSTIMDLAVLGKKAFFIPTSGQNEQEYLAKLLKSKKIAPYSKQQEFSINKLEKLSAFEGFRQNETNIDLHIFKLFERK